MAKNTEVPGPLYFAAGATDLAVEKLRGIPADYKRLRQQAKRVDVATVRLAVEDYSTKASGKALEVYSDLVNRGEKLVGSVRRQKATATTARKSVAETRTRAKATVTSAKKTAEAAGKATGAAANKVG